MNANHSDQDLLFILTALNKTNLTKTLNTEQIKQLVDRAAIKRHTKDNPICSSGDKGASFYLIVDGSVNVSLDDDKVATINSSQFFGMLEYFTQDHQRIATVTADNDLCLLEFCYDDLKYIKNTFPEVYITLFETISIKWAKVLDNLNHSFTEKNNKIRSIMNFFAATMFVTLLGALSARVSSHYIIGNVTTWATCILLSIYCCGFAIMIARSHFTLRFYGITTDHWRHDIVQSFCWSLLFIISLILLKYACIQIFNLNIHVFEFPLQKLSNHLIAIITCSYALFTIIQELIARGIIQGIIMQLAETRYEKIRGIVLVTLIFSIGHLHLPNLLFALAVIVPSLFWSMLYEVQGRRLIGVIFSHALIGISVLDIIGWKGLF